MTEGILTVIFLVLFTIVVIWLTADVQREIEREFTCVGLGYEGYDEGNEACYSGTNPMILVPYEAVFE